MLIRINGIKFIDLDKSQLVQFRLFFHFQPILFAQSLHCRLIPIGQDVLSPLNKIFRCFSRWQADEALGVFRRPFQESQGC